MDGTPTYQSWVDMRRRCNNPERPDYPRYGGRGIKVCDEWQESFETFLADMGERPEGLTLDRKDNAGPYCKDNCKWSTRTEQGRNQRTNKMVTVEGVTMAFSAAAEHYGVNAATAHSRIHRGWSIERTFGLPTPI